MTLTELLRPELVFPKIACASKDELITELVQRIYATGQKLPLSREDLLETIRTRSKSGGRCFLPGFQCRTHGLKALKALFSPCPPP